MDSDSAFAGFACEDCGREHGDTVTRGRCADCGGPLAGRYDLDELDGLADAVGGGRGMYRYDALLPVDRESAVSLGEGGTPLVEAPALAGEVGVARLAVKDEGQNPTGTAADRGASLFAAAARDAGAERVALASPGDDGQSVAAYAARAGLEARVFVPSRAGFVRKAMVNVHGADMRVIGGRLGDAVGAFEEAREERTGDHPQSPALDASPAATPYRVEGARTALFEVVEDLSGPALAGDGPGAGTAGEPNPPDAVVVPVGTGVTLVGLHRAARHLHELGVIDALPALHAVQPAGCAPVVDAHREGATSVDAVASPDTIVGELEVADPPAGDSALAAVAETGGDAVAVNDDDALAAGAAVASREGVEVGATGAVAAAGVHALADAGAFDPDDTVVLVNPTAGNKDGDVLRSYLMSQGV
ncbi:MAG: pyridoxal-phosphate dependent enzyme [Halobacteriaceae archaeon]